jgi:CheY-like chemotaxis protein
MDYRKQMRILVMDDDPLMRRLLKHYLQQAGYFVLLAANGKEGLKAAFCELPRLIIMDVMMEDMDGSAVLRELKKIPMTRNTPIMVLTTKTEGQDEFRNECESLGGVTFLSKPVGQKQLLEEVKKLTGG